MEITRAQLQSIADTLPISYYARARVEVKIDDTSDTSYFSPTTREIFISLNGVNMNLKNVQVESDEEIEKAVRAHLYHELSHAILTPKVMNPDNVINIFEDERIETLLEGYYMKVNFKEQCKLLNDFDGTPPKNEMEEFYYTVRFRIGKAEHLKEVDRIINDYADLNWNSNGNKVYDYRSEIYDLYRKIVHNPPSEQEWSSLIQKALEEAQKQSQSNSAEIPNEYDTNNANGESSRSGEGSTEGESQNSQEGENGENGNKTKQVTKSGGKGELFDRAMAEAFEQTKDKALYEALEAILLNFAKKNKGGNALQAHSGVLNPRLCGREDCRFFERKSAVNGTNSYGSLNLNLFIDCSGSFEDNAPRANMIINTLCDLERRYPFFSVNFAFVGDGLHKVNKKNLFLEANEGTHITYEMIDEVKSYQKKDTLNYNIVLYDGWASYDRRLKHCFQPYDYNNFTLVLDSSCRTYAKNVKNANVIFCSDYLNEFSKHIIKALQRAFR